MLLGDRAIYKKPWPPVVLPPKPYKPYYIQVTGTRVIQLSLRFPATYSYILQYYLLVV